MMARFWLCIMAVAVAFLACARPAYAAWPTYSQAMASCQSSNASQINNPNNAGTVCKVKSLPDPSGNPPGSIQLWVVANGTVVGWSGGGFNFAGVIPSACDGVSPYSGAFSGKLAAGSPMCQAQPDGRGCPMTFKPDSAPFLNRAGTSWATHGTYSPGSGACVPGPVGGDPASAPAPALQPTKSCAGGSCYDSANDKYCAVSGGTQVCVSGAQARSSGACASGGETSVCAGSPPPVPQAPPASPISDPSKEIKSSDEYTVSGANGNQTVTTNVYSSGNTATGSGQGTGDDGPASSSSAPTKGDGTTSSGGGDCNTPPIVQGSGGLSAVAYQTWRTRCALEGQQGGTGQGVGKLYTPSTDTAQSVAADFQAKVQSAPIAGAVTGFFSVGSVGGSCPTWQLAATDWNPQMTFDFYCRPEADAALDMARVVLLILCAYVAWVIAMGDS